MRRGRGLLSSPRLSRGEGTVIFKSLPRDPTDMVVARRRVLNSSSSFSPSFSSLSLASDPWCFSSLIDRAMLTAHEPGREKGEGKETKWGRERKVGGGWGVRAGEEG